MKRQARAAIAVLMSLVLSGICRQQILACAPELPYAILLNGSHPDLPLKLFAAGNIGIVQPGWAKSYLCVAYRYFNNKPLSKVEQESIIRLWHSRIARGMSYLDSSKDPIQRYLKLRDKVLGKDPEKDYATYSRIDTFAYKTGIGKNAIDLAADTLTARVKRFGLHSSAVREWLKAQDIIFGVTGDELKMPPGLPGDPVLRADRKYQIAAATFYRKEYEKAGALFKAISSDKNSQWKELASYMVLRCQARQVLENDASDDAVKAVTMSLSAAASRASSPSAREDIIDLLRPVSYMGRTNSDTTRDLAQYISTGTSTRFGGDVGDLTFLMDGGSTTGDASSDSGGSGAADAMDDSSASRDVGKRANDNRGDSAQKADDTNGTKPESSDLIDWLVTTQRSDYLDYPDTDEARKNLQTARAELANHALQKWHDTKAVHWLVSAVSGNRLRSPAHRDLFDAASKIGPDSPVFLTCQYYVLDSLIADGKVEQARQQLSLILSRPNLPPSTRNLFLAQMASISKAPQQFLKHAVLTPSALIAYDQVVPPNFFAVESTSSFRRETPGFDSPVAADLSSNAPLSIWISLAQNRELDPRFRSLLLRTTWLRAQLLNRPELASKLEKDLTENCPALAPALSRFQKAPGGAARQFALACLVLRNYGMSPYLRGGAERHGMAISEFDWYNNNFWLPLPVVPAKKTSDDEDNGYGYNDTAGFDGAEEMSAMLRACWQPGLTGRLNAYDLKTAEAERRTIFNNHPSRFLGQAVLTWAGSHPADPEVPEMLFRVVKLPKWSGDSAVGSEFSKKAYLFLHAHYPGDKWTKRAVCFY